MKIWEKFLGLKTIFYKKLSLLLKAIVLRQRSLLPCDLIHSPKTSRNYEIKIMIKTRDTKTKAIIE